MEAWKQVEVKSLLPINNFLGSLLVQLIECRDQRFNPSVDQTKTPFL